MLHFLTAIYKNHRHPAPWTLEISPDTTARAVNLCKVLEGHAVKVFTSATGGFHDPTARRVLEYIRDKRLTSFTAREIQQYVHAVKDAAQCRIILAELEGRHCIRRSKTAQSNAERWEVNPAVHKNEGTQHAV